MPSSEPTRKARQSVWRIDIQSPASAPPAPADEPLPSTRASRRLLVPGWIVGIVAIVLVGGILISRNRRTVPAPSAATDTAGTESTPFTVEAAPVAFTIDPLPSRPADAEVSDQVAPGPDAEAAPLPGRLEFLNGTKYSAMVKLIGDRVGVPAYKTSMRHGSGAVLNGIAPGKYRLLVLLGRDWDGHAFRREAVCYRLVEPLDLSLPSSGGQASDAYRITLYAGTDSKVKAVTVPRTAFDL